MGPLIVITLSVVVGAAAYAVTIRNARRVPSAIGFEPSPHSFAMASSTAAAVPEPLGEDADAPGGDVVDLGRARDAEASALPLPLAPEPDVTAGVEADALATEPGYTYLRVATRGPGWRDRVAGFAGIVVILVVGAAALAFGVYQVGHAINDLVQRFLTG
jgi:hypothetical protein